MVNRAKKGTWLLLGIFTNIIDTKYNSLFFVYNIFKLYFLLKKSSVPSIIFFWSAWVDDPDVARLDSKY